MNAYDIIKKPLLTEKSYADIANKRYTFVVDKDANKIEIKQAVEKIFKVKVKQVNTLNVRGKEKAQNTKNGRTVGKTSSYKKAIVWLASDSKPIEFFESLN
ncbi:MAG: 50S ribosomal protein L23 [Christensenellaceae bacterium]|jgi:large subunit ribosomal protein L23|nr:50S ribosomal protein L23 [Christensenellaceae bacterium]